MSDLESQIRELILRAPSEVMDQRVQSVLMATDAAGAVVRKPESMPGCRLTGSELSDGAEPAESRPRLRRDIAATVVCLIAAASLLIGIAIGRGLPTSTRNADAAQAAFSESFAVSAGEIQPGSGDASQIAESVSLSLRDAVVNWEQQTGQIFNVATHVHDRRFNMCRECHRIGG